MAITLVQSTKKVATGLTASTTQAFGSNVTAGSLLTLSQAFWKPGSLPTINTPTDTLGHTWTPMGAQLNMVENGLRSYYVANCSAGANTVTVGLSAYGANSDVTIVIAEWSGIATTTPLDQHAGTTGTSTLPNGGNITTTQADELLYSAMAHNGINTSLSEEGGDGWVSLQENEGGTSNMPIATAYEIVSSTTTQDNEWWMSGASNRWAAHNTSFKAAAGGGGTNYTITASAGSYAVTGTAAGIKAQRKVVAASGTYAMTGTAAAARVARRIVAAAGSYVVTGTAATLRATRRLVAGAGTYAVTGTDAALQKGRRMIAEAGVYAITGTATSFRRGLRLSAAAGVYTLTGTDMALQYGRRLVADAGTYALTGVSAALNKGRRLVAESGSYVLTGTDTGLRKAWRLVAAIGSYILTGSSVTLDYTEPFVAVVTVEARVTVAPVVAAEVEMATAVMASVTAQPTLTFNVEIG